MSDLPVVSSAAAERRGRKAARLERRKELERLRWWHPLLLLPLVAMTAWLWVRSGQVREDPADVLEALRAKAGVAAETDRSGGTDD